MKKPVILLACLATIFSARAEDKLDIKFSYKPGNTYHQEMKMVQTSAVPGQGEMEMEMNIGMSTSVKSLEGGNKLLTVKYESMTMNSKLGEKEVMAFDSAEETHAAGTESLAKIIKAEIKITTDSKDKPMKVEGLEAFGDDPVSAQMFNQDTMKEMISQSMLMGIPGKAVAKGDTWDFNKTIPNPIMSINIKGKYTYDSDTENEGHKVAVLKLDGKLAAGATPEEEDKDNPKDEDPKAAQMKEMMKKMGMEITEGEMKGYTTYDSEIQFMRKMDITTEFTMKMKNPQTGDGIELPVSQHTTLTLKKIDSAGK